MRLLKKLARGAGRLTLQFVDEVGMLVLLTADTFRCMLTRPLRLRQITLQIYAVGASSLVVCLVTGLFTGAVFAAQIHLQFSTLGMESATGSVVTLAMCRELGPVLSGLMVAGRVGSAMAAELATMKTSEQIDALRAMAVYPIEFLIVPRFLAIMISLPILVAVSIAAGAAASYVVAVPMLGVDSTFYWDNVRKFTDSRDIMIGLIKAFFFSIIIVSIACHKGLNAGSGAVSVGKATTEAMVNASISVLISNFFFTILLNQLLLDY